MLSASSDSVTPGRDEGDPDVPGGLLAQSFGDRADGELGGAVDGGGGRDLVGADGGDVHEVPAALSAHHGQSSGDTVQDSPHIDVDHAVPLVGLQRFQRRERHHSGVVDHHVHAAVALAGCGHEGADIVGVRDVQPLERRSAARGGDVPGERIEAIGAPCSEEQTVAVCGESAGGRLADPAARSGDRHDLGCVRHVCCSSRWSTRCSWWSTPSRTWPVAWNAESSTQSTWLPDTVSRHVLVSAALSCPTESGQAEEHRPGRVLPGCGAPRQRTAPAS